MFRGNFCRVNYTQDAQPIKNTIFAVVLKLNKMMNKAKPHANMEIQHSNANRARFQDT